MDAAFAIRKPFPLGRGSLLRIRDGRGVRVRANSGVLWITEEHSVVDHVLRAGEVMNLARHGLALVFAHRPARVVLEVPAGVELPASVEVARGEGVPGKRVRLGLPRKALEQARFAFAVVDAIAAMARAVRKWFAVREPEAPRGGWYEHDAWLSSRRRPGSRFVARDGSWRIARDVVHAQLPFPYH